MDRAFFQLYFVQSFCILILVTNQEATILLNNTKFTSSCDKGFISRRDRMHITVSLYVDQEGTLKDQTDLKITTNARGNVQHICTVSTTDCKTARCYCVYSAEKQRVFVTANILLQSEYSEGFIIAKVCSSATDCLNVTITQLPIVYDIHSVLLQINERNVSGNATSIQLSDDERHVKFCCLNSPTPCHTKIIQDNITLAQGTPCSNTEMTTAAINATFEFHYALCNDDFRNLTIQVLKSANIDDETSFPVLLLVLVCIFLIAILSFSLYLYCRKRKIPKEIPIRKSAEDTPAPPIQVPGHAINLHKKAEKILPKSSEPFLSKRNEQIDSRLKVKYVVNEKRQEQSVEINVHAQNVPSVQ